MKKLKTMLSLAAFSKGLLIGTILLPQFSIITCLSETVLSETLEQVKNERNKFLNLDDILGNKLSNLINFGEREDDDCSLVITPDTTEPTAQTTSPPPPPPGPVNPPTNPTNPLTPAPVPETDSPTSEPTDRARVNRSCPLAGEDPVIVPENSVSTFDISSDDSICMLLYVSTSIAGDETSATIGRTYNGLDWESVVGLTSLDFECDESSSTCVTEVPPNLDDVEGAHYELQSFQISDYTDLNSEDIAARFFEQATFGTTSALIDSFKGRTLTSTSELDDEFASWVTDQINETPTSMREYIRTRYNTRVRGRKNAGVVLHPCNEYSRWHSYTFDGLDKIEDVAPTFFVENSTDNTTFLLLVEGLPRTEIDSLDVTRNGEVEVLEPDNFYEICSLSEKLGGSFGVKISNSCYEFVGGNPPVQFTSDEGVGNKRPDHILEISDASYFDDNFEIVQGNPDRTTDGSGGVNDEFHLPGGLWNDYPQFCGGLREDAFPVLLKFTTDDTWLSYDPRLKIMDNLQESPPLDGGSTVDQLGSKCPNAYRNIFNEEDCIYSGSQIACSNEVQQEDFYITFNETDLVGLFDDTGKYLYAVENLAMDETANPCTLNQRARWLRVDTDIEDCNVTDFGDDTNETLQGLIDNSYSLLDTLDTIRKNLDTDCNITFDVNTTEAEFEVFVNASDGTCWKLVHPDTHSVYDFTPWVSEHPGGADKITSFAENDNAFLSFPASHDSSRWIDGNEYIEYVSRLGETLKFQDIPSSLQTDTVLTYYGFDSTESTAKTLICGSPYEVANDVSLGETGYSISMGRTTDDVGWTDKEQQRFNLWTSVVVPSQDQLRQRMAWALVQLFAISPEAVLDEERTEAFATYYDIFIRNAFGNFLDVLKEVSFSPCMAEMLTYHGSQSTDYVLKTKSYIQYADENYAREIMQLFTIGTDMMNMDGTLMYDENGDTIDTYTNEQIMSYARAWTGFLRRGYRGNTEMGTNRIDPMQIIGDWRDVLPKVNLFDGYVGDGYPLCEDLPAQQFLRKGSVYRLLGSSDNVELQLGPPGYWSTWSGFNPTRKKVTLDSASPLYEKLCNSQDGGTTCDFPSKVTLDENLVCDGQECDLDIVRLVEVTDGIYFEYVRQACVELTYYNDAQTVNVRDRTSGNSWRKWEMCANPRLPVAGEACCDSADDTTADSFNCAFTHEKMTYATAESRCTDAGKFICPWSKIGSSSDDCAAFNLFYHWHPSNCTLQVKVEADTGDAGIVHSPSDMQMNYEAIQLNVNRDAPNLWPVYWEGEDGDGEETLFPSKADNNCGNGACEKLSDQSCLCNTYVVEEQVFNSTPNSVEEVLMSLSIGSFPPDVFDDDEYEDALVEGDVTVYFHSDSSQSYDNRTIFMVEVLNRELYFKNLKSTVVIVDMETGLDTNYKFRNPPHFMNFQEADARDAYHETNAVLESVFYHPNTPPFLAKTFLNRFGISNPSPRYTEVVATAFLEGTYVHESSGTSYGAGAYGDLGATIAAILLDREARSPVLDFDSSYGGLKEPLMKVINVMRSMEFTPNEGFRYPRKQYRLEGMSLSIGQMAYDIETVFSFFRAEFALGGPISEAGIKSPEGLLYISPNILGLMDGLYSMYKYGFRSCNSGFGSSVGGCSEGSVDDAYGKLSFEPTDYSPQVIVSELATLLTSGRLNQESRTMIQAYVSDQQFSVSNEAGFRLAQQLISSTPEFHSTSLMKFSGLPREIPPDPVPSALPFKAVIYIHWFGGFDSFSLFVPYSGCGDFDMYEHYKEVRGAVHVPKHLLANSVINAGTDQVCSEFAIHPDLDIIKELYDDGDAIIFTNTGVLTEPATKADWRRKTKTQLFAHNIQTRDTQLVDGFKDVAGTGILGRMADGLTERGFTTGSFSIAGGNYVLTGRPQASPPVNYISTRGVGDFNSGASNSDMLNQIYDLNNVTTSTSGKFGKAWSDIFDNSIRSNILLNEVLNDVSIDTPFPSHRMGQMLKMSAKVMKQRDLLGHDRQFFYMTTGGFDTHFFQNDVFDALFPQLNRSFKQFVTEMKGQGLWDDVVVVVGSDFARTMSANSNDGTDHAWGGNYFAIGGGLNGGKIMGSYPERLDNGEWTLGRGRMIPSTSWDQIWNGIAEWSGIEDEEGLNDAVPNRGSFDVFTKADMFL